MRLQKQAILQKQNTVVTNIATNMMTTYKILHSVKNIKLKIIYIYLYIIYIILHIHTYIFTDTF
jgi:hypothetical protein